MNKFVYITVNKKFDNRIRISYSRNEEPASVDKIRHPLVRESLKDREAKLTKAQDELRKVLSVRQEATAVLMGLLK